MVEIYLNGKITKIEDKITLQNLITKLGLNSTWVVAELNGNALYKSEYPKIFLRKGDKLELVRAVSGG